MCIWMPETVDQLLDGRKWSSYLHQLYAGTIGGLENAGEATPTPVVAIRRAIIGQESGGNASVVNHSGSGALGLAQIMPENLRPWSREALGREVSPKEFLANPELQLKIIDHKLTEYWQAALEQAQGDQEEAVQRVAAWWYSGDPALYADMRPQSYNGDLYPSIADYAQLVLYRFRIEARELDIWSSSF